MRFDVITLFPEMIAQIGAYGVTGRAIDNGRIEVQAWNPRDYAGNRQRRVDDRSYGGGPGMVLQVEPLRGCLHAIHSQRSDKVPVIAMGPQGKPFDQPMADKLADGAGAILVSGRYEGIDQRFVEAEVDFELSVGDFIVSGGELPAMLVIDAVSRLLPGVLGDEQSAAQDSFSAGLLDHPHYTRPDNDVDGSVPGVLLSGDHAAIARWRLKQALGQTWLKRPDLLAELALTPEQRQLLQEFISELAAPEPDQKKGT